MSNDKENASNKQELGKKLIESAINIDFSLAELLKVEVAKMKKQIKSGNSPEDIQKNINVIRNIILCLTITDDKIRYGMTLYNSKHNETDGK